MGCAVRPISLPVLGHIAVLLAAVIPGAMATSVRTVYLVTTAHIDPFIVGTVNYTSTLLGILIVFYARKQVDRVCRSSATSAPWRQPCPRSFSPGPWC